MNDSRPGSACSDASLDEVLESFLARVRRGERPSLEDFADSHPEHREEIRELFPALMVLEDRPAGDVAAANLKSSEDGKLPVRLGEYRILREIGHGGMGVVYEAVQETLGRHVALKVLPPQALLSPGYVERFRREAQAAARLHHTNIVPVYGVGQADGVNFYAMQFIEGRGLNQVIEEVRAARSGELPRPDMPTATYAHDERTILIPGHNGDGVASSSPRDEHEINVSLQSGSTAGARHSQTEWSALPDVQYFRRVAELGVQVADALEHAHSQGILHRDVKPSNLLLDEQGRTWVTDFGLAKLEGADDLTHSGDIVGTIRYMAPERFQGRSDRQSDVYGLGLTLYELLTLRPAFEQEDRLRLIEQILHDSPPPPRTIQRQIPRDLETIVLKAIAREPAARYATAAELAEDLRRFLADRPIQARRSGPLERLWRWCRRNPALAISGSLACLALVAVAIVSIAFGIRERLNAQRSVQHQERLSRKQVELESAETEARRQSQAAARAACQKAIVQAKSLFERGEGSQGMLWLGRSLRLAVQAESTHFERMLRTDLALWSRQSATLQTVLPHNESVWNVSVSPDGRTILTGGIDAKARLWDAASGRLLGDPLPHSGGVRVAGFNSDGTRFSTANIVRPVGAPRSLAITSDGKRFVLPGGKEVDIQSEIRLWETSTRTLVGSPIGHLGAPLAMFSPDGRKLLTSGTQSPPRLWDADTGQPAAWQFAEEVSHAVFSPTGRAVLTGSRNGEARVWDAATGEPLGPPLQHLEPVTRLAFRPDGGAVLTGTKSTVRLWDVPTWQSHDLKPPGDIPFGSFPNAEFSPDSQTLATTQKLTVSLWNARTAAPIGKPLVHDTWIAAVQFRPDGQCLLTTSGNVVRLWSAATGEPIGGPLVHAERVLAVSISPDARAILTGSEDRTARLWDAQTGQPLAAPLHHRGPVGAVAFSPDARFLITGSADSTTRIWMRPEGLESAAPLPYQEPILAMTFSPDSKRIVTVGSSGNGSINRVRRSEKREMMTPEEGLIPPDIMRLAVEAPDEFRRVVDTTRLTVASIPESSSDQKTFQSADEVQLVRELRTWNADSTLPLIQSLPDIWSDNRVARSPFVSFGLEGRCLLTAGTTAIQFWETATCRQVRLGIRKHGAILRRPPLLSPDGSHVLAVDQDGHVLLWNALTCQSLGRLDTQDKVNVALFNPSGLTVFTGSDEGNCQFWQVATRRPCAPALPQGEAVRAATFSRDGRKILVATADKTAQVWDTQTGRALGPPLRHAEHIVSVAFSPDGRTIMTVSDQQTVRLSDASTGLALGPELHYGAKFQLVPVFSPDGALLGAALKDGTVRVWRVPAEVPGTPDQVENWLQIQTGLRLDNDGQLHVLDAPEWQQARHQWKQSGAAPPLPASDRELRPRHDALAWHNLRALECERQQLWATTEWHVSRLLESRPADAALWIRRGYAAAMQEQWDKASSDYFQAHERNPADLESACTLATLLLLAGKIKEYQSLTESTLDRFANTSHTRTAYLTARICVLGPASTVHGSKPQQLAEQAVKHEPRGGWNLHTLGLVHYRAGQYDEALSNLRKSTDTRWDAWVLNTLLEAMVLQQTGRKHEARNRLQEAVDAIDRAHAETKKRAEEAAAWESEHGGKVINNSGGPRPPAGVVDGFPQHIHDWLACHLLRREAESLILGMGAQSELKDATPDVENP